MFMKKIFSDIAITATTPNQQCRACLPDVELDY
jgi:hypothetical protein